jgi:ATP-dependent Lon protease
VLTVYVGYARESGVRNLRKFIERIHRKAALEVCLYLCLSLSLGVY